jgi:Flp pilus assembly pilin Flp
MRRCYQEFIYRLQCLMTREQGQDLVEYTLLIGVIAAAITASTKSFAILITTALSSLAAAFNNAL